MNLLWPRALALRTCALLALLAVAIGCDARTPDSAADKSGPGQPEGAHPALASFAAEPAPMAGEACAPQAQAAAGADVLAGVEVTVRLFVGAGVTIDQLRVETLAARAYFAHHGVRLRVRSVAEIDLEAIIAGRRASRPAAPGEDATQRAVAPMRAFLRAHAPTNQPDSHIDVVLLPRIVRPDSPIARYVQDVAGLAISPQGAGDSTAAALTAAIALERYTPTIFLSRRDLKAMPAGRRQTTLAHEFGHALGLAHSNDRADLMSPARRADCVPRLSADELATMRASLRALPAIESD